MLIRRNLLIPRLAVFAGVSPLTVSLYKIVYSRLAGDRVENATLVEEGRRLGQNFTPQLDLNHLTKLHVWNRFRTGDFQNMISVSTTSRGEVKRPHPNSEDTLRPHG